MIYAGALNYSINLIKKSEIKRRNKGFSVLFFPCGLVPDLW